MKSHSKRQSTIVPISQERSGHDNFTFFLIHRKRYIYQQIHYNIFEDDPIQKTHPTSQTKSQKRNPTRQKIHQKRSAACKKRIKKEVPRAKKMARWILSEEKKKTRRKPTKRSPTATTVTRKLTSRQLTELQNRGKTTITVNGRKRIIKPSDVVNCTVRIR